MNEPLDELYFKWLYSQVGNAKLKNPDRTHWSLLRQLYSKEFIWIVPNDDNRLEDGLDLRRAFVEENGLWGHGSNWLELGCSMLEMLVALARTLAFEDESRDVGEWFWEMMRNLGLDKSTDRTPVPEDVVNEVLDDVIWRTYKRNGQGGLFPLRRARKNQCDVELWYQMNAYILENN